MNDRFRFRAWNKEEKKMYYDAQNTYDYMTGKPVIFAESFSCLLTNDEEWEVEQCTGLKDKNGKLIYEGDIIHDLGEIEPICSLPLIVRWDDRTAGFYLDHQKIGMRASLGRIDSADSHNYEIIGNIHNQPEQKDK